MGNTAEQNQKAARNGRVGEKYASIVYETPIATNAVIDGEYQGRPLEVKTSQVWITDAGNFGGRRRGRFYLRQAQHEALLECGGLYAFVLLDEDGAVLMSRLREPRDVCDSIKGVKQIIWPRIFPEFL